MIIASRSQAASVRRGFLTPTSLVLLLLVTGGGVGNDLVSWLPAEDYFQVRKLDTSVARLMELASKDPTDGKTQIQQLLALRVLGEDAARVKKADGFAANVKILKVIAAGKKAQDRLGFAREYAAWTLTRLGVKGGAAGQMERHKLSHALNWFPDSVTLAAAVDIRPGQGAAIGQSKGFRELAGQLIGKVPPEEKAKLYAGIEELGNIRLDRIAFGYTDSKKPVDGRFYFRVSGKADHQRLMSLVAKQMIFKKIEELKGARNEPIAICKFGDESPRLALVGDDDLILSACMDPTADSLAAVQMMLAVRAGKKDSAVKGGLASDLKKVAERANGFVVGAMPQFFIDEAARPGSPITAVPRSIIFESEPKEDGIQFRFRGKMPNIAGARNLLEDAGKMREQALTFVKQASMFLKKDDGVPFDAITKVLTNIKMEAAGDTFTARMHLPADLAISFLKSQLKLKDRRE